MSEELFMERMGAGHSDYAEGRVDVSEFDEIFVEGNQAYVKITGTKDE